MKRKVGSLVVVEVYALVKTVGRCFKCGRALKPGERFRVRFSGVVMQEPMAKKYPGTDGDVVWAETFEKKAIITHFSRCPTRERPGIGVEVVRKPAAKKKSKKVARH